MIRPSRVAALLRLACPFAVVAVACAASATAAATTQGSTTSSASHVDVTHTATQTAAAAAAAAAAAVHAVDSSTSDDESLFFSFTLTALALWALLSLCCFHLCRFLAKIPLVRRAARRVAALPAVQRCFGGRAVTSEVVTDALEELGFAILRFGLSSALPFALLVTPALMMVTMVNTSSQASYLAVAAFLFLLFSASRMPNKKATDPSFRVGCHVHLCCSSCSASALVTFICVAPYVVQVLLSCSFVLLLM
jgi:hypothetical protein